jgi:ABC-2 type transport system permease protein
MRVQGLIVRIIRQFIGDKRAVALLIVAPIFVLTLTSWVFKGDTYQPKLATVNVPAMIQDQLKKNGANLIDIQESEIQSLLKNNTIDGAVIFSNEKVELILEGSDPMVNRSIQLILQKSIQPMAHHPSLQSMANQSSLTVSYIHGSAEMVAFDSIGPVLLGFFAFFFVFLLAGVSFLRERTGGTLERLMVSPIRRGEIVVGYVIGYAIFAILQTIIITLYATRILHMMMVGSIFNVFIITLLLSLAALTLATLLSAFANNEFQMIQFIPLVIVPQVFFSGLFRLDTMILPLQWLSLFMPLRYGANALREVMIRGGGLANIWPDLLVLSAFSVVFMILNVLALRRQRAL